MGNFEGEREGGKEGRGKGKEERGKGKEGRRKERKEGGGTL